MSLKHHNELNRRFQFKLVRKFRSIKTKLSRDLEESSGRSRRGRPPWADNAYAAGDDEIDRFALSELGMLARR